MSFAWLATPEFEAVAFAVLFSVALAIGIYVFWAAVEGDL